MENKQFKTRFCNYCGKKISQDSIMCNYCGRQVEVLKKEKSSYYKIPISMFWFWFWLVITVIFTIASMGILFFLLVIPIIIFLQLKKIQYLYNDREFII